MVVQRQGILLERHNQILNYSGHVSSPKEPGVVFEAFITCDERYFILNDHVIDIQEKTNLGYLWESMSIFKTIFSNVENDTEEFGEIRESVLTSPLVESTDQNLYELRDFFLEEGFGEWISNSWLGKKVKAAGKGISDFYSEAKKKLAEFGAKLSNLQWKDVWNALGRGLLWILRKFKAAAYSTIGIIVDAILVATGIGKVPQMVFWGLVTGLDVYQLISGDWDPEGTPMWMKILDLVCDLIGLLGAGLAAKGARVMFKGVKSISQVKKVMSGNKAFMNIINKIKGGTQWITSKIKSVLSKLKGKWSALDKFINKITGFLSKAVKKIKDFVIKMFPDTTGLTAKQKLSRGVKAGTTAGALIYGIEKGVEAYTGVSAEDAENFEKTMQVYDELYDDKDPFDEL